MSKSIKRLAGPGLLSAAAVTKYTVPASTVGYLTQIHVANVTGTDATFTLSVGADAAGTELYTAVRIPANQSVDFYFSPAIALVAAEIVQALSGTANALNLTLLGYETTNN